MRLIRRNQRLEQGGLTSAGGTDQESEVGAFAEGMNGAELGGAGSGLSVEFQPRGLDGRADFGFGQGAVEGSAGLPGVGENGLLERDLLGMGDAQLLDGIAGSRRDLGHPRDKSGGLAVDGDAAVLDQLDDAVDVVRPFDADFDQAAGGVEAQTVVIDDCGGPELLGELAGGERVGVVVPLGVGEHRRLDAFEHGLVPPADCLRLGAPDFPLGCRAQLGATGRQAPRH